jgi:hypothetical protein
MLVPAAPAKASQSVRCQRSGEVPIDSSSQGSVMRDIRSVARCHDPG